MRSRVLLTVVSVVVLAGCAGKGGPKTSVPEAINGRCGSVRDVCLLGDPSNTGDTSSPYGWMCLGRNGGQNDTCSVPTAPLEWGESFSGQDALVDRIKARGPLRGRMALVDFTFDSDDPTPSHASVLREYILQTGVPEENIVMVDLTPGRFLREFYRQGSAEMQRREFRDVPVVALPVDWAEGMDKGSPDQIRGLSKLFITAAGNACHGGVCDGRLWFPDHPWWSDHPGRWENVFAAFATGKFIIARYAWKVNGVVVPRGSDTDLCGHAMEYCYSLLFNENMPVRFQGWHSSVATARLGAMAFYLFQLWDTPEEVVETLNVCAEDVGAPGPDEEFGRGIVGSPKTGVGGIGADSAGPRGAATAKGQLRTDPRIPLPGRACGGLLRMSGAGSYGTAGVSTRYARPPLGSGPSDDTPAVPPLREQLWALRPGLDGGVPAVDDFTPDARGVVGAWA